MINHFNNNACLTAKRGLCLTLKNLIWHKNVDIDTFFPRCFHLNDTGDYYDFLEEFKAVKAEAVLKKFMDYLSQEKPISDRFLVKIHIALLINQKRLKDLDTLIRESLAMCKDGEPFLVTDNEWSVIHMNSKFDKEEVVV